MGRLEDGATAFAGGSRVGGRPAGRRGQAAAISILWQICGAGRGGHGAVHSFHARRRYYACGGESGPEKEAKRGTAMEKHPIESLMGVSMDNIKDMVDVNTVIGDPVQTQDGSTIIPISRVAFGFVAGGGEYAVNGAQTGAYGMPFAGGAGAGVSIHPMGFLVCGRNGVRLLSAGSASPMERVAELIPQALKTGSGWATSRKTRNRLGAGGLSGMRRAEKPAFLRPRLTRAAQAHRMR
ncbi:MAG: GerW family sporulation protein [Christensenellales bacterium]